MKKLDRRKLKKDKKKTTKLNLEVLEEELDSWEQVKEVHQQEALQAEKD